MAQSNPNKANQHVPDPRQSLFLSYYLDRGSDTFANCLQSALKAGYAEEYAKVLIANMPTWLSENLKDQELIQISDNNVKELMLQNVDLKVKNSMTQFVKKGLQKEKYSERMEHTGANGKAIEFKEIKQASDEDLYKVLNENNANGS